MIGKPGSYIREARPQGLKIGATASPDHGGGIGRAAVRTRKKPHAGIVEAACACRTSGTTEARTLIELRRDGHIVGEVAEKDGVPAQSRRKYGGRQAIQSVEVCRYGQVADSTRTDTSECSIENVDRAPPSARTYLLSARNPR